MSTKFKEEYFSCHTVEQLYDLVLDIEKYPLFLPWCIAAKIVCREENTLLADLTASFKGFIHTYQSRVTSGRQEDGSAWVEASSNTGPFKRLHNLWQFEEVEGGTLVKFFVDFEFKSFLLERLMRVFFSIACQRMLQAFEARAEELYGR